MNILIGSGFAETISQDIASNRNNYGNNFETIKKTKSKIFFEELFLHTSVCQLVTSGAIYYSY